MLETWLTQAPEVTLQLQDCFIILCLLLVKKCVLKK